MKKEIKIDLIAFTITIYLCFIVWVIKTKYSGKFEGYTQFDILEIFLLILPVLIFFLVKFIGNLMLFLMKRPFCAGVILGILAFYPLLCLWGIPYITFSGYPIITIVLFIVFILFLKHKEKKNNEKSYIKWSRFITGFFMFGVLLPILSAIVLNTMLLFYLYEWSHSFG
jgi:hypothetical protein